MTAPDLYLAGALVAWFLGVWWWLYSGGLMGAEPYRVGPGDVFLSVVVGLGIAVLWPLALVALAIWYFGKSRVK
jgi:hypothetical protein